MDELEKKDFYKGSFLTLKSSNMVKPTDSEKYDNVTNNILKA